MKLKSLLRILKNIYVRYRRIGSGDVLIYTMGKVGSSVIYDNLDYSYQTHNLDNETPSKYFSSRFTPYLRRYVFESLRWNLFYRKVSKLLSDRSKANKKIKIISVVRDPVARNISAFFQNIDESQIKNKEDLSLEFFGLVNHFLPLVWFDIEMKKNTGVNIFDFPFDKDEGWGIFSYKNYEVMIIQLERLNEMEDNIREFLGSPSFTLKKKGKDANISDKKWYADFYSYLKGVIVFPESYLEIMYSSKYVKHFYSEQQIKNMRSNWKICLKEECDF